MYDSNDLTNRILKSKEDWDKANAVGDNERKAMIANTAKSYYQQLRDNGDQTLASNLESRGYADAKKYKSDYNQVVGRQAFRPYMESLAKKYGMTADDINKLTSFNEKTGEVTFGGNNLGKPLANVDGTTYWDEDTLNKSFDNYVNTNGISRSNTVLANQGNEDATKRYKELYDMNISTNPYETAEGKAIMDKRWKHRQLFGS